MRTIYSGAQQHRRVTAVGKMHCTFQNNIREDFECSHYKQMVRVYGSAHTNYSELITLQ